MTEKELGTFMKAKAANISSITTQVFMKTIDDVENAQIQSVQYMENDQFVKYVRNDQNLFDLEKVK